MTDAPRSHSLAAVAAALVLAFPVAVWWVAGASITGTTIADPDYMVRPLTIDPAVELAVGVTAAAVVIAATVVLVVAGRSRRFDRRWWSVLGPLLAVGAVCSYGYSIVTVPVIGANIGGGLVLLTAPPVVVGLVVWAGVRWFALRR